MSLDVKKVKISFDFFSFLHKTLHPRLVDAVARDIDWLHATLEPAAKADPFTGRLLKISKEIHREVTWSLDAHRTRNLMKSNEIYLSSIYSFNSFSLSASQGLRQPMMLGIHRSDYMLHQGERFLQVELNTIASSMGAHACNAPRRGSH